MQKASDAQLMDRLKQENCHLDLDICGTAEKHFIVSSPESIEAKRFKVFLSDECILAPMAFFHTELLELTRQRSQNGIRYGLGLL